MQTDSFSGGEGRAPELSAFTDTRPPRPPALTPTLARIRVWDLPVRIFHWSLVVVVLVAFITGKIGGSWMDIHGKSGLAVVGLVVFRVVWGFAGSTYARFVNFFPSPATLLAYLQGRWQGAGHNPLGALSVFALLGLLALQAVTGLFGNDDIAFAGPLSVLVEASLSARLTGLHHTLSDFLLGLMALHVIAVIFYIGFKKNNLIKPMLTGWKKVSSRSPARTGSRVACIAALLIALAAVYIASGIYLVTPPPAPSPSSGSTTAW